MNCFLRSLNFIIIFLQFKTLKQIYLKSLKIYIILVFLSFTVCANSIKVDSLWHAFKKTTNDSIKIVTLLKIGDYYEGTNNDSSIICYKLSAKYNFKTLGSLQKENEFKTHRLILYLLFCIGLLIVILMIFGFIILRNKRLQKRNKLEKELIQHMQKAVNQQMNPHFIFNTLNSIQYFLLNNDKISSSKYISKFSQLMRITLDNSQTTLISLITEIEAIKLYLELEQIRYKNKFIFELIIDPEIDIELILIPPLIIQPHIENAIWHGFMHIEDEQKGNLKVQFNYDNNNVKCILEDNGIGRKRAEEIKNLNKPEHKSLGTKITKSRIDIINQMFNCKIEIKYIDLYNTDEIPAGTRVEIIFPYFSKFNKLT